MCTSSIGTVRSPACITNIRLMSTWWYVVGFRTRSILAPIAVIHAPRILGAPLGAPRGSFFINHFVLAAPSRLVARHRAAQSCKLLHRPRAISPAGAASSVPILQRTQRETHTHGGWGTGERYVSGVPRVGRISGLTADARKPTQLSPFVCLLAYLPCTIRSPTYTRTAVWGEERRGR